MRRVFLLLAVLALPATFGVVAGADRPAEARGGASAQVRNATTPLARRITARLRKAKLPQGSYSIVVMTRGPGRLVRYTANSATALVPASAAKVLTAAAVLDVVGPSHVFRTQISARGSLSRDGVLDGDLVLHGAGDPSISGRYTSAWP